MKAAKNVDRMATSWRIWTSCDESKGGRSSWIWWNSTSPTSSGTPSRKMEPRAKRQNLSPCRFSRSSRLEAARPRRCSENWAAVLTRKLISNSLRYGKEDGTTQVRCCAMDNCQHPGEVADDGIEHVRRTTSVAHLRAVLPGGQEPVPQCPGGSGLAAVHREAHHRSPRTKYLRPVPRDRSTFSFTIAKA